MAENTSEASWSHEYKDVKDIYMFELCAEALDSFKINDQAVDIYIKDFLTERQDYLSCADETFIIEVFSGCVYYNKILEVLVNGFYQKEGKTILKTHYNLFKVLSYLVIFRLSELDSKRLCVLALSQNIGNMSKFFSFLLDERNIKGWVYDGWCEVYEKSFVDSKVSAAFQVGHGALQQVMSALEERQLNDHSPKIKGKPATEPQPFNMTEIQPRAVPVPKKIPKVKKPNVVPESNRKKPIYERQLNEKRKENREKVLCRLEQAEKNKFRCADPELAEKAAARLEKIRLEEDSKLRFNQKYAQERLPVEQKPIKMNTAAILREGLLYRKREKESEEYVMGLLRGDFDRSKFDEWQRKVLAEDQRSKTMNTQYRKMMGKIAREQAVLSRKEKAEENRRVAEDVKEEYLKKQEDMLEVRVAEEKRIKELIDEVARSHRAAQEAKERSVQENQQIVKELNAKHREMMRQALVEEEERMKQRSETIAQIRALEHIRPERKAHLDTTSTAGHRLISEMSLAELQERLSMLRDEQEAERERKQEQIRKAKEEKSQQLMATVHRISAHRHEMTRAASIKARKRDEVERARQADVEGDEKLKQLQRKLELKKKKRADMEREEQHKAQAASRKLDYKGLIRDKRHSEHSRWRHLENSHQRMAQRDAKITDKC